MPAYIPPGRRSSLSRFHFMGEKRPLDTSSNAFPPLSNIQLNLRETHSTAYADVAAGDDNPEKVVAPEANHNMKGFVVLRRSQPRYAPEPSSPSAAGRRTAEREQARKYIRSLSADLRAELTMLGPHSTRWDDPDPADPEELEQDLLRAEEEWANTFQHLDEESTDLDNQ